MIAETTDMPRVDSDSTRSELPELLAGAFDRVGNFLGDFFGAGARIGRDDQRFLDRELGVFEPADLLIGDEPAHQHEQHGHEHDAIVVDREDAWVHEAPPPSASPRSRTFMPLRRNETPATAI